MHERTKQLDRMMTKHRLTARQVGDALGRKPHTVRVWRCNPVDPATARIIPAELLDLLRLKIKAGEVA